MRAKSLSWTEKNDSGEKQQTKRRKKLEPARHAQVKIGVPVALQYRGQIYLYSWKFLLHGEHGEENEELSAEDDNVNKEAL